jgi:hypothetical protein
MSQYINWVFSCIMEGMPPPRRLKPNDLQSRGSLRQRHSNFGNDPAGGVVDGLQLAEDYEQVRDQMSNIVRIQSEVSSPIKMRALGREYDILEQRLEILYGQIVNEAKAGRYDALELLADEQDHKNSIFSVDYEYANQLAAANLNPTFNRFRSELERIRDSKK